MLHKKTYAQRPSYLHALNGNQSFKSHWIPACQNFARFSMRNNCTASSNGSGPPDGFSSDNSAVSAGQLTSAVYGTSNSHLLNHFLLLCMSDRKPTPEG